MAIAATMLVLPVAVARKPLGVERGGGAAGDHADVVGEVGLGQLAAEGVEDPGQLVDGAVAQSCRRRRRWNGRSGRAR